MVETITPVVHGPRKAKYWRSVALHTLGAGASAALLGLLLGAGGAITGAPWGPLGLYLVLGAALLYAAREGLGLPLPLFDRRRQVPEWWRTYFSPSVSALLYGSALGVGFLTFLSYGTFVVVSVAAFTSGDPPTGMLLCAPFGLARGLSIAVEARGEANAASAVDHLDTIAETTFPRRLNAASLLLLALAALIALL